MRLGMLRHITHIMNHLDPHTLEIGAGMDLSDSI